MAGRMEDGIVECCKEYFLVEEGWGMGIGWGMCM